jgi:hypothetical protein
MGVSSNKNLQSKVKESTVKDSKNKESKREERILKENLNPNPISENKDKEPGKEEIQIQKKNPEPNPEAEERTEILEPINPSRLRVREGESKSDFDVEDMIEDLKSEQVEYVVPAPEVEGTLEDWDDGWGPEKEAPVRFIQQISTINEEPVFDPETKEPAVIIEASELESEIRKEVVVS